jgi:hypothetical protein
MGLEDLTGPKSTRKHNALFFVLIDNPGDTFGSETQFLGRDGYVVTWVGAGFTAGVLAADPQISQTLDHRPEAGVCSFLNHRGEPSEIPQLL